jgi:predicted ATPase
MIDSVELRELERRIQVVEDNLRQLQEEATAVSGAADEERIANRIADQEEKLAALLKQREALIGNA